MQTSMQEHFTFFNDSLLGSNLNSQGNKFVKYFENGILGKFLKLQYSSLLLMCLTYLFHCKVTV